MVNLNLHNFVPLKEITGAVKCQNEWTFNWRCKVLPEGVQCENEVGARKFDSRINKKSDENKKSKVQSSDTCFNTTNKVTGPLNARKGMNQSGWPTKSVFYLGNMITSK